MTLYNPKNRVQDTLASSFAHGTDTSLTLNDAGNFPSEGNYILIQDNTAWAIYEYTGKSTNDLTGLSSADPINESTASHTFSSGTSVKLVSAADIISDVVDILQGTSSWPANQNAGGNSLVNLTGIEDGDRDTSVFVDERGNNENIVRIYAGGSKAMTITPAPADSFPLVVTLTATYSQI